MNALKDNQGNYSSLRIILFAMTFLLFWMFWEWKTALRFELSTGNPDYKSLIELFLSMMVSFGIGMVAKLIQKKFEK